WYPKNGKWRDRCPVPLGSPAPGAGSATGGQCRATPPVRRPV
ncbi:MAG: hypothetical protein AVDCRST_MAG73-2078, partial [uncultured Thermomicrobiales bacterium]